MDPQNPIIFYNFLIFFYVYFSNSQTIQVKFHEVAKYTEKWNCYKLLEGSLKIKKFPLNPFQANIPFMERPDSWLLQAKCVKKHLCENDILSKDAGPQVDDPHLYLKCHSSKCVFSHILLVKTNYLVCS